MADNLCTNFINGEKMKKLIISIMLIFSFSGYSCCNTLSMRDIVAEGMINNPQIKVEQAKLKISDAKIKEAGTFINPRMIMEATLADNTYKAGIEQTIELGGKRKKRISVAKTDKEIAIQNLAQEMINLRTEIKNAYINLYIARENLKTAREICNLTQQLSEITDKMEKAGNTAKLAVYQAENVNLIAQNELLTAQTEAVKAFNNLNNLLGNTLQNDIEIAAPSVEEDYAEVIKSLNKDNPEELINYLTETAFINRLEIKISDSYLLKNKQEEKLAKSKAIPDISISAGPNINVEKDEKTTTKVSIFAAIEMDLPIYNHGQAELMNVKAQRDIFNKQTEVLKKKISLEIKNLYSEAIQNEKSVKLYETSLIPRAEKILEKSKMSFKEGKSDILVPLNSQQSLIETKKGYLMTLSQYYKSLNNLEKAIGANNDDI